ncbi:MAG: DUF481 domain-containing protein [Kiritimatiellaceae bacterium]|nr:DUF481 domain-containing protein [Kiritimatiellaceae bacterium]
MFRFRTFIFFLIAGVALSCSALADQEAWEKFAPPEDKRFDWIQMNSGEWLKGEIKVMYNYSLEFDSDELDLLFLDMDDVKQIRSCGNQRVMIEKGRRNSMVLRGLLVIDGERVKLIRGEEVSEFKRYQLVSIAGGAQRERDNWSGSFSIGITARGGNTETMDITTVANLKRRTAMTRLNIDYLANYSEASNGTTKDETANNQRLTCFFDWFLTSRFYWQVLNAEYYRDPFVNIRNQYSVSTGVGYDLIRTSKTEWTLNMGAGYQKTQFDLVQEGDPEYSESPFATIGTRLDYEISGDLDFLYDYSARFLSDENGAYTHHMVTTLSYELIADFNIDISLIWDRIEKPTPSVDEFDNTVTPEQDDLQLVVGIGYSF